MSIVNKIYCNGKDEVEFFKQVEKRNGETNKKVSAVVNEIIENVRENGDEAVREYTVKFDGKAPEKTEITADEIDELIEKCDSDYLQTVKKAAENIHKNNKKRVVRALELHYLGSSKTVQNENSRKEKSPYDFLYFVLQYENRQTLYDRSAI